MHDNVITLLYCGDFVYHTFYYTSVEMDLQFVFLCLCAIIDTIVRMSIFLL